MRTRFIIVAVFLLVVLGLHANVARAAILPKCDQTIYYISDDDNNPYGCDIKTSQGCKKIQPDDYEKNYPAREDKDKHPPIVTTETACGFSDFIQLFVNLANYGLAILGVLTLAFVIWGGFMFITAAGNPERVRQGKATIWGGVLGTVIVLTSWVLVGFIVGALTGTGPKLFVGTQYERHYAGNKCPSYKRCDVNDLKLTCRDDQQGNQNAVTKAQSLLARFGCYDDDVDGCFGPRTDAAVRKFQKVNSDLVIDEELLEVDGIIGAKTWRVLNMVERGDPNAFPCAIPSEAEVTIKNTFVLEPQTVRLPASGGRVRWKNESNLTFTVNERDLLGLRGEPRPRSINPGGIFEFGFAIPRTYTYSWISSSNPINPLVPLILPGTIEVR